MGDPMRTRPLRPTTLGRLSSACTAGMALTVATGMTTVVTSKPDGGTMASYGVVLPATLVAACLLAAVATWCTKAFEARLAVVVLASLTVLGQVVVGTLGEPGVQGPAAWSAASSLVVLLGLAVPALVTLDVRRGARNRPAEHPYAL